MEFVNYNANPKGKKTGDCVIRAICTALNESWEDTYKGMFDIAIETGHAVSCKENYKLYLERKGYKMRKMFYELTPYGKKRITVKQFVEELAEPDAIYILNLANHVTCVKDKKLYDIWDCGRKSIGNWWVIPSKENVEEE